MLGVAPSGSWVCSSGLSWLGSSAAQIGAAWLSQGVDVGLRKPSGSLGWCFNWF